MILRFCLPIVIFLLFSSISPALSITCMDLSQESSANLLLDCIKRLNQQIDDHSNRLNSLEERIDSAVSNELKTEQVKHCKRSQYFEVCVDGFSQRGNNVIVSLRVNNVTSEDIQIKLFGDWAILISESGEIDKTGINAMYAQIKANNLEYFSFDFRFKKIVPKDRFDFIWKINTPRSEFAFYGLSN